MKSAEGTSCLNSRYEPLSPLGVNLFFHRSLCLRSQGDWAFESTANSTMLGKLVQLNEKWVLIPQTSVRLFKPLFH